MDAFQIAAEHGARDAREEDMRLALGVLLGPLPLPVVDALIETGGEVLDLGGKSHVSRSPSPKRSR